MTRLFAAVVLLALPAVAAAQVGTPAASGPAVLGGHIVTGPPIVSGANALFPVLTPAPSRFSVGGGALGGYPQVWLPSGPWGGVSYRWPVYPDAPTSLAPRREVATLVAQFPAATEVWVRGVKQSGGAATEWVLTSPPAVGGAYVFEVRGRWREGGRTFEVSRSVPVTAGDRSRWVIVSGTKVGE